MSPADLLRAYCRAFAARDVATIESLFAEDAVCDIPLLDERLVGRAHVVREIATAIRGLRGIRVELGAIVEGDDDAMAEGLFFGALVGHPAQVDGTPARTDFRFVAVVEAPDGKIARLSEYFDTKPLKPWQRQRLFNHAVRQSPYWESSVRAGAVEFMAYNHMTFPIVYGRTMAEEYVALTERVTLWDVGCERQTELRGPDALRLADYLASRDLSKLELGACRYAYVCDPDGRIICDPVILRPWPDVVWLSHGMADLTLWARGIALEGGWDVAVSEPDVAPLQVQGPHSADMLRGLVEAPIDALKFYRCTVTKVAGIDAVVSRTGWSGALGFEIFPLGSARAIELWDALIEAGRPHGLVVTGPVVHRAVERNVTDTAYATNSGMNPYEAGGERMVDLDAGDFIGRDALARIRRKGARRRTVGLFIDGDLPRLEWHWPLTDARGKPGVVRWAAHSFALDRAVGIALVDAAVAEGERVRIDHPGGGAWASVTTLPFVEA
ncbi:MAG: nuclear transport factor 2 family protein [Alphaproteobacteria bacterium]